MGNFVGLFGLFFGLFRGLGFRRIVGLIRSSLLQKLAGFRRVFIVEFGLRFFWNDFLRILLLSLLFSFVGHELLLDVVGNYQLPMIQVHFLNWGRVFDVIQIVGLEFLFDVIGAFGVLLLGQVAGVVLNQGSRLGVGLNGVLLRVTDLDILL